MTDTPTLADYEAALEYRRPFNERARENHKKYGGPTYDIDLYALAEIGLRALKAKEGGAKMVGPTMTEPMTLAAYNYAFTDHGNICSEAHWKGRFNAVHNAAECLIEGEK